MERWPYDRNGYYSPALAIKLDYRKLKKIVRKIKRFGQGKGPALTKEEQTWFRVHLFSSDERNGTNEYFTIIQQIIEGRLEDQEYCASLYPSENILTKIHDKIFGRNTSKCKTNSSYHKKEVNKYSIHREFPDKLYEYCTDLTAKEFKYNPAIGRRKELEDLMVTILTPNKCAVLTGHPGVGKTAIIEGLAYNIQHENVPEALKGYSILQTSASILNSNCSLNGMLEKRVLELFNLLSNEEKVILFIDEMHTLIGTGRSLDKSIDIANIIKPFLTSNDICLIGATTLDEYDEYISNDPAFQRRFIPIDIAEPDDSTLKQILYYTMENYSKQYNVDITDFDKEFIAQTLVRNTNNKRRNTFEYRYNPDLAISIIATAFGYARLHDKKEITINDISKAYLNSDRVNGELDYSMEHIKCNKKDKSNNTNNIIDFKLNKI